MMARIDLTVNTDYLYKAIEQAFDKMNEGLRVDMANLITYYPTTGYSAPEKPATVLQQLATRLDTDDGTALDWLVCKVAQFRGVSESEVKRMIEGG